MNEEPVSLKRQYSLRFSSKEKYRDEVWKVLCSSFFHKYIHEDSKVLDVGAGWGEFINNIKAAQKTAMDLNPETADRLSPDVRFLERDCGAEWDMESGSLDVIFSSNFFEHLTDKSSLERAISESYRCLSENGVIICVGPNIKYLPGAYWDFWDHYLPLTEQSMAELLKLKGFVPEVIVPRFLPYTMSNGKKYPLIMLKAYLKLPVFWPLFGKQFLVVGRKALQRC